MKTRGEIEAPFAKSSDGFNWSTWAVGPGTFTPT